MNTSYDDLTVEQLLEALALARSVSQAAEQEMKQLVESVKTSAVYTNCAWLNEHSDKEAQVLTDAVKSRVLAAFDGKNKRPIAGVSIKEKTRVAITDEAAARQYAFEKAPGFLKLDQAGLGQLAKKLDGTPHALAFVEIRKELDAEIASNLSKYLQDVPVNETDKEDMEDHE